MLLVLGHIRTRCESRCVCVCSFFVCVYGPFCLWGGGGWMSRELTSCHKDQFTESQLVWMCLSGQVAWRNHPTQTPHHLTISTRVTCRHLGPSQPCPSPHCPPPPPHSLSPHCPSPHHLYRPSTEEGLGGMKHARTAATISSSRTRSETVFFFAAAAVPFFECFGALRSCSESKERERERDMSRLFN